MISNKNGTIMKIQIISDTHYEHYSQLEDNFLKRVVDVKDKKDTVLIMAGDIASKPKVWEIIAFYKKFFKDVIHISGNHEYYWQQVDSDFKSVVIDDTEFVMATLWTSFGDNPLIEQYSGGAINDFHLIRGFNTNNCVQMHRQHLGFIKHCLSNPQAEKQVVVTHFAPSTGSIHKKYAGQLINDYFVNNLDEFVMDCGVPVWIHGHCHDPFDYVIGNTRVICNPYGYMTERSVHNPNLVIDV